MRPITTADQGHAAHWSEDQKPNSIRFGAKRHSDAEFAYSSHEITAFVGKGGMGEVYRARDLKLKREVAIKTLPEEFSLFKQLLTSF